MNNLKLIKGRKSNLYVVKGLVDLIVEAIGEEDWHDHRNDPHLCFIAEMTLDMMVRLISSAKTLDGMWMAIEVYKKIPFELRKDHCLFSELEEEDCTSVAFPEPYRHTKPDHPEDDGKWATTDSDVFAWDKTHEIRSEGNTGPNGWADSLVLKERGV